MPLRRSRSPARFRAMIDRGQQAVAVDANAKCLAGRRTMAYRAVHLFTAQHEFDRSADQSGRHDAEDLRPGHQALGAEAASQKGAANVDLLRGDAEQPRDPSLGHGEGLARRIDRQHIAVPRRHDGVRLHGVVVLGGRFVGCIDAPRRGRESRFHITTSQFGWRPPASRRSPPRSAGSHNAPGRSAGDRAGT